MLASSRKVVLSDSRLDLRLPFKVKRTSGSDGTVSLGLHRAFTQSCNVPSYMQGVLSVHDKFDDISGHIS